MLLQMYILNWTKGQFVFVKRMTFLKFKVLRFGYIYLFRELTPFNISASYYYAEKFCTNL